MSKILIVEDEQEIAMLEKDYLEISGYETEILSEGKNAVQIILEGSYDLIILDLMLPGCSGYDICREIRDKVDIPILMVTARTESIDKIRGLGIGADDYIAKPFDPAELVARVKSHLLRYERLKKTTSFRAEENIIELMDIKINLKSWKVYKKDKEIRLPTKEFELLSFLVTNPNIVFTKEQIFEKIWGYDFLGDAATVTVHINRIRDKIEEDPSKPKLIETIWGVGYRLNR